jgi:hypothetical protein
MVLKVSNTTRIQEFDLHGIGAASAVAGVWLAGNSEMVARA